MRIPRLKGWKLWTWSVGAAGWSVFYLFFERGMLAKSANDMADGPLILFNLLFPIALLYLMLTIGRRR